MVILDLGDGLEEVVVNDRKKSRDTEKQVSWIGHLGHKDLDRDTRVQRFH